MYATISVILGETALKIKPMCANVLWYRRLTNKFCVYVFHSAVFFMCGLCLHPCTSRNKKYKWNNNNKKWKTQQNKTTDKFETKSASFTIFGSRCISNEPINFDVNTYSSTVLVNKIYEVKSSKTFCTLQVHSFYFFFWWLLLHYFFFENLLYSDTILSLSVYNLIRCCSHGICDWMNVIVHPGSMNSRILSIPIAILPYTQRTERQTEWAIWQSCSSMSWMWLRIRWFCLEDTVVRVQDPYQSIWIENL